MEIGRTVLALGLCRCSLVLAALIPALALPGEALAQLEAPPQAEIPPQDQALEAEPVPTFEPLRPVQAAILQGLNKTTARVSTIEAPIGAVVRFGTLEITARACKKKPPTETPESTAFLEIVDVRPDSPSVEVFTGWMFASSPAISALEHPVYDVWVIDCSQIGAADTADQSPN